MVREPKPPPEKPPPLEKPLEPLAALEPDEGGVEVKPAAEAVLKPLRPSAKAKAEKVLLSGALYQPGS